MNNFFWFSEWMVYIDMINEYMFFVLIWIVLFEFVEGGNVSELIEGGWKEMYCSY